MLGAAMRIAVTRSGGGNLAGLLLLGLPGALQFAGCTVHVDLAGMSVPFAFANGWTATVFVPADPSLIDVPLRAQAILGPFAAPPWLSFSDAWMLQPGR